MIRPARTGDEAGVIDAISAVYREYGFSWEPEGYHADLYDLAKHYPPPDQYFWVAELEGRVVATGALDLHSRIPGADAELISPDEGLKRIGGTDCGLERVYVHPDFRRLGLGKALTMEAIEEAKARGCRAMEIWSDVKFTMAHSLYLGLGAQMVGTRLLGDVDDSTEYGLFLLL
ncbi:MAG: GNAT family N-acetyltransferase [Armatimonadetes bacterium]|nr:GNAT family N-acetyltransferase [Armatimonadota bacterium]